MNNQYDQINDNSKIGQHKNIVQKETIKQEITQDQNEISSDLIKKQYSNIKKKEMKSSNKRNN